MRSNTGLTHFQKAETLCWHWEGDPAVRSETSSCHLFTFIVSFSSSCLRSKDVSSFATTVSRNAENNFVFQVILFSDCFVLRELRLRLQKELRDSIWTAETRNVNKKGPGFPASFKTSSRGENSNRLHLPQTGCRSSRKTEWFGKQIQAPSVFNPVY